MDGGNESVSGLTRNAECQTVPECRLTWGPTASQPPRPCDAGPTSASGAARDPLIVGILPARSLQQRLQTSNPLSVFNNPDMEGGMTRVPPYRQRNATLSSVKNPVSILRPPKIRRPLHSLPCVTLNFGLNRLAQAHRSSRHPKSSLTRRVSPCQLT